MAWYDIEIRFSEKNPPRTVDEARGILAVLRQAVAEGAGEAAARGILLGDRQLLGFLHRFAGGAVLISEEVAVLESMLPQIKIDAIKIAIEGQIAVCQVGHGEFRKTIAAFEPVVRKAVAKGLYEIAANLNRQVVHCLVGLGRLEEARQEAKKTVGYADLQTANMWHRCGSRATLAHVLGLLGAPCDQVLAVFIKAEWEFNRHVKSVAHRFMDCLPGAHFVEWLLSFGAYEEALIRATATLVTAKGPFNQGYDRLNIAQALYHLGRKEEAQTAAAEAITLFNSAGRHDMKPFTLRILASITDEHAQKRAYLEQAVNACEGLELVRDLRLAREALLRL